MNATNWYDVEREYNHLIGELKDAQSIFKEFLATHKSQNSNRDCTCSSCEAAREWLAKNK